MTGPIRPLAADLARLRHLPAETLAGRAAGAGPPGPLGRSDARQVLGVRTVEARHGDPHVQLDPQVADTWALTVTGTTTITPAAGQPGDRLLVAVTQDTTGGHDVYWGGVSWPGETEPAWTATPDAVDLVELVTVDGTIWFATATTLDLSPVPFSPLLARYPQPAHAVWAEDPAWTPPADGGQIAAWPDLTGNGLDLAQAIGANRPLYRASVAAFGGRPAAEGDGTNRILVSGTFTSVPQPFTIVAAGEVKGTSTRRLCGGHTAQRGEIGYADPSTTWTVHAGTALNGGTADQDVHVFAAEFNGSSSALVVDGVTVATGNAGTGGLEQIRLFGSWSGQRTAGHIHYWGLYPGTALSDGDLDLFLVDLASHIA